ncbi:hypothetical protein G4B88_006667 [Cannabis sativa]|uniref:Glutamine amidotransferase domain-containing protein n=1 Tax=Cannabis sativa TaxID=3483 RepID=A0A7J6GGK7_CANSA|nr:hypothetical protein G4B88_006667 [Cannabis sativa]
MAIDPKSVESDMVLILDYGSQYTHLITRRIRFLDVFSLCLSGTSSLKTIADYKPRVVILSGGPHSVHTPGSPSFPHGFIEWPESINGVFVLRICYGLQLIFQKLGETRGIVRPPVGWSNPNSSSARFNKFWNKGWFKYSFQSNAHLEKTESNLRLVYSDGEVVGGTDKKDQCMKLENISKDVNSAGFH